MATSDTDKPGYLRGLLQWLRQVAADSSLPPMAVRLAVILTEFINTKIFINTGVLKGWPAVQTLADKLGGKATARGVQTAVAALVARGHLEVQVGGGRAKSNQYFLLLKTPNASSGFETEKPRTAEQETPNSSDKKPRRDVHPTLIEDSVEDFVEAVPPPSAGGTAERESGARARRCAAVAAPPDAALAWAEFWPLWNRGHADDPRKIKKAFLRAVARHGIEPVMASARTWAASRESRFLPEPVRWLAGGWRKEPAAKASSVRSARASRHRKPSHAEIEEKIVSEYREQEERK
jgi:hypothetical protein